MTEWKLVLLVLLTCFPTGTSGGIMKMRSNLKVLKKVAILVVTCNYEPTKNDSAQILYINQFTKDGWGFAGVAFDVPEERTKDLSIYKIRTKVDTRGGPSFLELFIRYATPEDEGIFECGAFAKGADGNYRLITDKQTINLKTSDRKKKSR